MNEVHTRLCPACEGDVGVMIGELPVTGGAVLSRPSFGLLECDCSLIYTTPLPTAADFRQLYETSTQFDSPEYTDPVRVGAVVEFMSSRLDVLIAGGSEADRPLTILEVGAGVAWMCRAAKGKGLVTLTVAQDVSDECAGSCPWVDEYVVGGVDSARLRELGPFDLISATHVLEHVPDPVELLSNLAPLLKANGVIFVTMPHRPLGWDGTVDGWTRYSYNHVPAHLQYFSRSSMRAVARKAGLDLAFWDQSHEDGEALEAHLRPAREGLAGSIVAPAIVDSADAYRSQFEAARPFKHVMIDGFLDPGLADALLRDFPAFDAKRAMNEFGQVGGKAVNERIETISPAYARFSDYVKSEPFLSLISALTGIPDLLPDPNLYGGGTHENRHGQELDPHIDFNYDPPTKLHRRLNLLVYLNKDWRAEWGGSIELHSNPREPDANEIIAFTPDFNRAVIFETNEYSWHGFPKIDLPPDKRHLSRKSLSIYLYTRTRPADEIVPEHGTFYVQRPLPDYIRPGRVLSEADIDAIKTLLARRDSWIAHYQRAELRISAQMGEFQERLREQGGLKRALARSLRYRWNRLIRRG